MMDQALVLWLFGTLIGLQTLVVGGLVSAIWTHARECRDFRAEMARELASIATKVDRIEKDIGTHETGLRGQVHKLAGAISPYILIEQQRRDK